MQTRSFVSSASNLLISTLTSARRSAGCLFCMCTPPKHNFPLPCFLTSLLLLSRRHTGAHVVRIALLWKPMQRHPDRTAVAGLNRDRSGLLQKAQSAVFGIPPDPQFDRFAVG